MQTKFYMKISFPIENDFDNSTKIYETKIIKFYKSLFLLAFLPFKNFALRAIGIKKIIDTNWLNYAKIKQDKATKFPIHPLLRVNHIHKILIFNKWIINLDHFTFILLRKFFIVGDKKIYPECLMDHFFLKVLYEMSNLRLTAVFSQQNIEKINNHYFDPTNSLEALIEGRFIIGRISRDNYNFLKKYILDLN